MAEKYPEVTFINISGDDALTGSGSVITQDVPDAALALARAKQVNKPEMALRLMTKLKKKKAAANKKKGN